MHHRNHRRRQGGAVQRRHGAALHVRGAPDPRRARRVQQDLSRRAHSAGRYRRASHCNRHDRCHASILQLARPLRRAHAGAQQRPHRDGGYPGRLRGFGGRRRVEAVPDGIQCELNRCWILFENDGWRNCRGLGRKNKESNK